jgi:lipopolysaccharide export system protein LptA
VPGGFPARRLAAALSLACACAAAPAAAQRVPVPQAPAPRPAQARADTTPRDTTRHRAVAPPDSLYNALLRLPGYTPVEYQADSAQFDNSTRTLRLRGGAVVTREGTTLNAVDSIVYRERSRFVEAYGKPKVTGQGEDIAGNVMFYDLNTKRASVRGARTKVAENGMWYVEGNVTSEAAERVYATSSTFTTDDRPEPAYHFKADRIMVVRDRLLVGRPAVLYFRNVPVMALPFIVQNLEKGRRSGLLIPQFDVNDIVRTSPRHTERGTGREISNLGYYWALNQYMGVQMAGSWRSGSYRSLAGGLDFRVLRSFLDGGVTFENYWRSDAQARNFNLAARSSWKPSERTDLSVQANYASSSSFERQRTIDPARATATLHSSASLGRRFDWGNVNLSSELSQSLASDDKQSTLPSLSVSVNPITLFRSADPEHAGFFNDATLNLGLNGTRRTQTPGNSLRARQPATTSTSLDAAPSLSLHSLTLGTSFAYARDELAGLAAIDSAQAVSGTPASRLAAIRPFGISRASWSASTSYQFRLIGTTTFSPSVSLSQNFVSMDDSVTNHARIDAPPLEALGRWVSSPARVNFGATVSADLFGFFPGVGPYSGIRHHVKPGLQYGYTPGFAPTAVQRAVFGSSSTAAQNKLTLSLDQTFEGKLREPRPTEQRRDSTSADSAAAPAAQAPSDARKVTILAINTSALTYDFNPVPISRQDLLNPRFVTSDITNTIRSDLLGGLNMTVGHNLFRRELNDSGQVVRRHFAPYLTSFSTSFTLGQSSAIFRFLGLYHEPNANSRGDQPTRPDTTSQRLQNPQAGNSAFGNTQQAGGGPWSASIRYSLQRSRPDVDTLGRVSFANNQDLSGSLQFYPTKNWGVSWNTSYSVTGHAFTQHSLSFTRNLYRWQANFDFFRTATGNTAFSFRVHLIDLPDLKFDYRESNLGFDRPQTLTTP